MHPIEKIALSKDPQSLFKALDRYVQLARDHGANDARIIASQDIRFDERVRLKCRFPVCEAYNTCLNCPPHTGSVEEMRQQTGLFKYAIMFKVEFPEEPLADERQRKGKKPQIIYEIIRRVESAAFYDGYYFATGFAAGSCRKRMCHGKDCQALTGQGCRFSSRAYASMEAVGMDVYRMAAGLGWDIYPVGKSCPPDSVPVVIRCGLILID